MNKVQAALEWKGGKIYLFGGDLFVRLDPAAGRADPGYPKSIAASWPGLFDRDIDAAVLWNNGKAYFFRRDEYIRYDVAADRTDAGFPKKIAGSWPGLFPDDLDAAVLWNNGKAYFFKGDRYVRYDVAADKTDAGYPRKIAESWPGLFTSGIDDAVVWSPGQALFLKSGEYLTYDMVADRASAPKAIPLAWFGNASQPQPAGEPVDSSPPNPALSARRQNAIAKLKELLPAPYGSQKWNANPYHSMKPGPVAGYTNCVEFPAYLVWLLGGKKLAPGFPSGATPGWKDADGVRRPLPGDIYVLCKTATRDATVSHVGVIVSSEGAQWETADWGQTDGWGGDFVKRTYDATKDTLTGEVDPSKGNARPPRAIKGWVDLDAYPFP